MPSRTQVEELVELLDGEVGAVLEERLDRFTQPARGEAGPLGLVVLPRTTEQVRLVIGWARRRSIRLLPQGANTGLVNASTPGPEGGVIVLSTERLRGSIDIDAIDRTVIVHAGTRLSELNAALAAHGLTLPIDLGADPSIGGMAATNTGGARMLRYGDMRRHVLGLEAVVADAERSIVDELSVLRKDNTGLALSQLFVGSGGALGVITRVALEVEPLPSEVACAWLAIRSAQHGLDALVALERTDRQWLSAFEVVSREALVPALELIPGLHRPFADAAVPEFSVLVEFSGPEGACEALVDALVELDARGLIVEAVVGPADSSWAVRHSVSEGLRLSGTIVGFDVSVPRSSLPEFLRTARARVAAVCFRATVADFGHWGDGGVHCTVVVPFDAPLDKAELAQLRELIFGLVVHEFHGSFSAEHGLGPINAEWWGHTTSPGSQLISRQLKALFDPLDILGHPALPYS